MNCMIYNLQYYLIPWLISFFFMSHDVIEVNNPPAGGHSFKVNFCPVGEASCEAVKRGGRFPQHTNQLWFIPRTSLSFPLCLSRHFTLFLLTNLSQRTLIFLFFFHIESEKNSHGCRSPVWVCGALHAAVAHLWGSKKSFLHCALCLFLYFIF